MLVFSAIKTRRLLIGSGILELRWFVWILNRANLDQHATLVRSVTGRR